MKKSFITTTQKKKNVEGEKNKSFTTITNLIKREIKNQNKRKKSFKNINKLFRKKMEERNSKICLFHKFVIMQNHKGMPICPNEWVKETRINKQTYHNYIGWLRGMGFVEKIIGTSNIKLTSVYQKCLEENAIFIFNKCDGLLK